MIAVIAGIALLAHYGLPEKKLPPPPPPTPEEIMPKAEPWRLEASSEVAFLICHGYSDSAFSTLSLGKHLYERGYTAIGILLPGHGTSLEDFNNSRYYHWRDYLERVFLKEHSKYRHLFLVGLSMGGTLCLDVAARNANTARPCGIITVSTPLFFNGFFNGKFIFNKPAMSFSGIVKLFTPFIKKRDGRTLPSVNKIDPWIGYTSAHSLNSLHSFKRGLKGVRRGLERITVPYCNIMSATDRTVSPENQYYIYSQIQSSEKRAYMITLPPDLSTMHTLLTHKRAYPRVFNMIDIFTNDVLDGFKAGERVELQNKKRGFSNLIARIRHPFSRKKIDNFLDSEE